jgi:hypothetical protein
MSHGPSAAVPTTKRARIRAAMAEVDRVGKRRTVRTFSKYFVFLAWCSLWELEASAGEPGGWWPRRDRAVSATGRGPCSVEPIPSGIPARKVESERVCRNEGATTDAKVQKNPPLGSDSRGSGFGFTGLVPSSRSRRSSSQQRHHASCFTTPTIPSAAVASASVAEGAVTRGHLAAVGALPIRGAHRPPCSGECMGSIPRAFLSTHARRWVWWRVSAPIHSCGRRLVWNQNRCAHAIKSWV